MKKVLLIAITLLTTFSTFAQAPTSGLVAYYPLNNNGNNIISQEFQGIGSSLPYNDRYGNTNGASQFTLNNGFSLGHLNIFEKTTTFTISFWILSNFYDPFIRNGDGARGYIFSVTDDSGYGFYIWTGGGSAEVKTSKNSISRSSPTNLSDKAWHQVIISYSNKKYNLYIDGLLDSELDWNLYSIYGNGADPLATATNSICKIGYPFLLNTSGQSYGQLVLDDLRIYNRSLNTSEINQLYDSEKVLSIPQKKIDVSFNGTKNPTLNSADSYPEAIANTTDGGKIIACLSKANAGADKSHNHFGAGDIWVIKVNDKLEKIWDITLGGSGSELGSSTLDALGRSLTHLSNYNLLNNHVAILETKDKKILIVGSSNSPVSGNKTSASKGNHDFWVIKLDEFGNKVWDKTFGGTQDDFASSVVETTDGNFVILGSSISGRSFEKSENSNGNFDFWAIKIDKDGNKLWDKTLGGNEIDCGKEIVLSTDGNLLLGGTSYSSNTGNKSETSRGDTDFWIIKISSSNGSIIWEKTFGGAYKDLFSDMLITENSDIYILGDSRSNSSFDKTENNKYLIASQEISTGSNDIWVLKLNQNGVKQWDRTIGGYSSYGDADHSSKIISAENGNLLILGNTRSGQSFDISKEVCRNPSSTSYYSQSDFLLYSIDSNGNKNWDQVFGGFFEDISRDICRDNNGDYYLIGMSTSSQNCNKSALQKEQYSTDCWVVKLGFNTNPIVNSIQNPTSIQKGTPLEVNFKAKTSN